MTATKYSYAISTDFPSQLVNGARLISEISGSAIVTAPDHVDTEADVCDIWMKAALSEGDETLLDGLVAAHSGAPLPMPVQLVDSQMKKTVDLRQEIRNTYAVSGKHRLRAITFYTSDPSKLFSKKPDFTDYGDVTCKCFDVNGDEITSSPYTGAVKTTLEFEPTYAYEIIGGELSVPPDLRETETNQWYGGCTCLPDVPAESGGNIDHVSLVNLEAFDGLLEIDGKACVGLNYNAQYHTNKIRCTIYHPAGSSKRFQLFIETFH